jgi:hypothetical protein
MGNGDLISFWHDPQGGNAPLRLQFPSLFQVFVQRDVSVGGMSEWYNGDWVWDLSWRRELLEWELALRESFLNFLVFLYPKRRITKLGVMILRFFFPVKTGYHFLLMRGNNGGDGISLDHSPCSCLKILGTS